MVDSLGWSNITFVFLLHPRPDEYVTHTSCMTEAERYEKSVFKGVDKKKKRNPQESWMELIASASSTAPTFLQPYMKRLAGLDNVPRKPKQFRNFTANSLNLRGKQATDIVDGLWNNLTTLRNEEQVARKQQEEDEKQRKEQQAESAKESSEAQVPTEPQMESSKVSNGSTTKITATKVRKAMKRVLKKAPNKTMKVKDLRRAVRRHLECEEPDRKLLKTMLGEQIKVDDKRIKLDGKLVTLQ